jgi:hypothetical protein
MGHGRAKATKSPSLKRAGKVTRRTNMVIAPARESSKKN